MDILIGVEMVCPINLLSANHQVVKHQIPNGPSWRTDLHFWKQIFGRKLCLWARLRRGRIIVPTFKPPQDVRFIEDTWGSNGYILESDPHKIT